MPKQSGVIPWRESGEGIEVLLITTTSGRRWIIPKGFIEAGMSPAESARKEAWEEAGITGHVDGEPVGCFRRRKWGTTFTVEVFRMKVADLAKRWPEEKLRRRAWFSVDDAALAVEQDDLAALIRGIAG